MKSVSLSGGGEVTIEDVPDPVPGEGEVLIQTAVSALCGSEMHSYRSEGIPEGNSGHEGAGTVVAVGEGVPDGAVSQRVGVSAVCGCGDCSFCERGQYTWCEGRTGYGSMHAERFVAAYRACHVLPDDVAWEEGALLSGDGFGVPFHTNAKFDGLNPRAIAIFGVGPIGLGSALLQSYLGREVIAVDVKPARLGLARALGAAHTVNATDVDAVDRIREVTEGRGADVCIEAAGRPETAKQCFAAVRTAGLVVFNGEQSSVDLSPSRDFIRRDVAAVGSWFYHFSEFDAMLKLYRDGLPLSGLVTHRFPLDEAAEAFRAFAEGETGKVILTA